MRRYLDELEPFMLPLTPSSSPSEIKYFSLANKKKIAETSNSGYFIIILLYFIFTNFFFGNLYFAFRYKEDRQFCRRASLHFGQFGIF